MVLEAVLYFVLGFLCAGLLALMVSPAIWNRAVILTKRKIESSVPLTLNEVQADKDQLRAEFAMSTRRLEMNIEELKERASAQLIDINRKRDELTRILSDRKEKLQEIQELESRTSELRANLAEREAKIEELSNRQIRMEEEMANATSELSDLRTRLSRNDEELNSNRIELVAKEAAIDNLNDAISSSELDDDEKLKKIQSLKKELAAAKAQITTSKKKKKEADQTLENIRAEAKRNRELLDKRERDLSDIRASANEDDTSIADLSDKLAREKAKNVELETQLARQTLTTESLLNDASNENVKVAMTSLNDQLAQKTRDLKNAVSERDRFEKELLALQKSENENWASERQENAILRERMNDMAAKVAAMTAAIEGENSPINKILDAASGKKKRAGGKDGAASNTEKNSLAERIRALQDAANSSR